MTKKTRKPAGKTTAASAVELREGELDEAQGGFVYGKVTWTSNVSATPEVGSDPKVKSTS